jgi:hypothetical protein
MVTVSFNGRGEISQSVEAFDVALARFGGHARFELWLSVSEGPSMCMLRNGEHAFLMYLRFPGDSGFVSSGKSAHKEPIEYTLSNGQVDRYPQWWCISVALCFKALAYFFANNGARPEWVAWRQS